MTKPEERPAIDFILLRDGNLLGFHPISDAAKSWLEANVESGGWQWLGGALWIDARMGEAIVTGIVGAGLEIIDGETWGQS